MTLVSCTVVTPSFTTVPPRVVTIPVGCDNSPAPRVALLPCSSRWLVITFTLLRTSDWRDFRWNLELGLRFMICGEYFTNLKAIEMRKKKCLWSALGFTFRDRKVVELYNQKLSRRLNRIRISRVTRRGQSCFSKRWFILFQPCNATGIPRKFYFR